MMEKIVSIERRGLAVGFVTALALVAFFMTMKALNLAQIIELRFFNIVILGIGICYGIVSLKHRTQEHEFYLKGLAEGIIITVVSTITFAIFMTIYLTNIDQVLMREIGSRAPYSGTLDGMVIFITIFMEGMASGAIISFAAMQYFKRVGTPKAEADKNN